MQQLLQFLKQSFRRGHLMNTRDLAGSIVCIVLCLLPIGSLVLRDPGQASDRPAIEQLEPQPCPNCPPPSPEKCAGAGGGVIAALLLIARIAHASGKAPWLAPFFDWLAARRQPPAGT
jgi:hypothetical protein